MGGIAGWVDYGKNLTNEGNDLKKMVGKFAYGAPDFEGFWISGHTLIGSSWRADEGEQFSQPVICKKGETNCALVFSGEIYNTRELIRELEGKGHVFTQRSTGEAILRAYIEWGDDCTAKLNGVFTIAVRDAARDTLFIARDRLGVKPLFYTRANGKFIFASALKALLQHGDVRPVLGRRGLAELFVTGPARTPGCGIFEGVYELKPGEAVSVSPDGETRKKYWQLESRAHEADFGETADTVRELFIDSVRRQADHGGKTAFMLSGGVDSSAICSAAARESADKITTFSVDYLDNDVNFTASAFQPNTDAPWITRMSEYLEAENIRCVLDTPELYGAIYDAVRARDFPGMADIDSSLLLFSRLIKTHADVALTGECADEIFGGYPWFHQKPERETFPWAQRLDEKADFYSDDLINFIKPAEYAEERYREALGEVPLLSGESEEESRVREISYLTLTRWAPTLLDRQEAMSGFAGLTLRAPFSDYRLVEYLWNVPWSMKHYKNREKGLLRFALDGLLPDDVLWRKKSPYPKTHNPNYIELLKRKILHLRDDATAPISPFIDKEKLCALALGMTRETNLPWFGQLMNAPQLLAYILQVNFWLNEYGVEIA